MLRPIVICVLLCTIALQGFGVPLEDTSSYQRTIVTDLPNPITVSIDSKLYIISKTNKTLSVNSTDVNCKFSTDPFDENIQGRISAVPLNKSRKILVWGIQSSYLEGAVRTIYYTLLIVDPLKCNYKAVPLPEDSQPANWPLLLPQTIVYENTQQFYIFYSSHQRCAPCWFDSTGRQFILSSFSRQLQKQTVVPGKHFWIKEYYSSIYKYLFHAYNFDNGSALIELVDDYYFRSVKRIQLNHPVDAASVGYGTYQNTAICYISGNSRQEVTCQRLNKRLTPGMSWNLPSSNHPVTDVFIEVDSVGNTFIGTISSYDTRFYVYNVDGFKIVDWVGQNGRTSEYQEVNGIKVGDHYCIEAILYFGHDATVTRQIVDCFDVKNI